MDTNKENTFKESTERNLSAKNKIDFLNDNEKQENSKYKNNSFPKKNIFLFLFTEFSFFISLYLLIRLSMYIPKYHPKKIFTSKTIKNFNPNEIPKIFLHISDMHISNTRSEKTDGSLLFLNSLLNYNPDLIILTGDVVDNFKGKSRWHRVGIQNEEDWNIYNKEVKKMLSKYLVIDVPGNHDVWAVDAVTSKENKFLDNSFIYNRSNVKTKKDFNIKKIKIFNLTFILFNDYRFPTPRPPYGNDPYTNKEQLDLLENTLDELDKENCFILTHYNVDRIWFLKSSKKHTFEEIISKPNVYAIFTGHRHPRHVKIIHHGDKGGLEYCTPSSFDKKNAGLITIDNENLVYHEAYIPYPSEIPKFFLTYPVPNEQISSHHVFNLNNFEIRVLSYINDTNIKLKIRGDILGELKYKMSLKNGALLYSYPINLKNGNYNIHIYDENGYNCNISTNFTIGNKYEGKKEHVLGGFNSSLMILITAILFFVYIMIIIFPFKHKLNFNIVNKLENIIKGEDNSHNYNLMTLIILLYLFSPFILRKRYQSTNKVIKLSIFFVAIYPFILPIHFFDRINGTIGFVNIFTIIGSSIRYEHWCVQMIYIFYVSVIFPYAIFCSGFSYYNRSNLLRNINYIVLLYLFAKSFYLHIYAMAQAISLFPLILTSGNVICWIFLTIIIYLFRNKRGLNYNAKKIIIIN